MLPCFLDPSSTEYKKARRIHLKTTKHRNPGLELDWTPFRAAEKKYKTRFPPPDLSNVLDLANLDPSRRDEINRGVWRGRSDAVECRELVPLKSYIVPHIPGLVILPSFVPHAQQKDIVRWALHHQARSPNETNLDAHYRVPPDGVWNIYLRTRDDYSKKIIQPKATTEPFSRPSESPGPRQLVNNEPASTNNYLSIASVPKLPPLPSPTARPNHASDLITKLRWANIGWSYHWGSKQYDFSQGKGSIHPSIRELCKAAVAQVEWRRVYGDPTSSWGDAEPGWTTWDETYEPDAGIVNFYQLKDTLMAHVDRYKAFDYSVLTPDGLHRIGNAAIFLIGGEMRDSEPVPILLRSGDVVIMSGPNCRRAYHGIPRILEGTLPTHLTFGDDDWKPYGEYLQTARINVNMRQVFPKGFVPRIDSLVNSPSCL